MRRNDVFPSKYLKAEDIKGREVKVTINYVEMEEMPDGKKTEKPVVYFKGKEKGVVLNSGNWDILEDAFGDSDDWPGKQITLYTERTRKPDGTPTDGIRVRVPPQAPPRSASAPPPPTHEDYVPDGAMDDEIPF
jgi:hypothetical protein